MRLAVTDCVTGDAAGEMVADREALRDCDRDGDAARLRDNVAEADLDGGNGVAARERVLVSVDDTAVLIVDKEPPAVNDDVAVALLVAELLPVPELVAVELKVKPELNVAVALDDADDVADDDADTPDVDDDVAVALLVAELLNV